MKNIFKAALIFLLLLMTSASDMTHAQEFSSAVNPAVLEIEAEAPARVQAPITLRNLSDEAGIYRIYLRPFKAGSELNGEPNFDPELNNEYSDFFNNVAIYDGGNEVTEVRLGPRENKDLNLIISLPSASEARDYYFTVIFLTSNEPINESTTNQIDLRAGVGTNVLLSVGSKQQSMGRIASFSVPRFITGGPVKIEVELANHNDFFVTSQGNVIIKNMFRQAVGNLEFGPVNILANSNRLVSNTNNQNSPVLIWDEKFPIGIYTADLTVALSDKGPLLKESRLFLAVPVKALIIIIAVTLLLIWIFRSARRKSNEV